jgi:DNA-3-methyladenine glycosylase
MDPISIDQIQVLPREFYLPLAVDVAPHLLGKVLVRRHTSGLLAGVITEAEAYQGEEDLGCHAKAGLTPRTRVMYGPPGRAYVYFTYGMHWMLNAVACPQGTPAAVLIRAIYPILGLAQMKALRPTGYPKPGHDLQSGWTDGPAKLTQSFGIDQTLNDTDLCDPNGELWIGDAGFDFNPGWILNGPRIGLYTVPEPWKSKPWRWWVDPTRLK